MNKGNNVLMCIGLLILIYFLFSGAVIEGITTYMKGSAGALCDSGKHIATKKECGEALKSLDLPTKEWWTGNDKEMPPYCSISIGKDPEQAQWNESVTGKGHEGSFAICKGDEGPKTPEQADADLTQKARDYLRGIGDELKDLGKLRNKKRRTPVNIHIDVGDGPGQSSIPVTTDGSRPSLGSAGSPTPVSKEGFAGSLFPPTLGISHYGFTEGFLEGIGEPKKNDYGLQNQPKNNGDIRNVSEYTKTENIHHQHSPNDQHHQPSQQPVSQAKIDAASLKNNHLNGQRCTEIDHRGCRWWGMDSTAEKEKKKREMEADAYNTQLESNYRLELENWKLEEKAKKDGYDKEKAIWDEQQKNLREEREEKQEAEKQRREESRQDIAMRQQMVKDNDKFDRIEQINKLAWKELSKPEDPNDPTTLSGKANIRYEKDLLNWWEAEQHAHAAGMPANPNIKPPTMANLTAHTSDKVASLLADFQSQDWGGAAGAARDTQAPNRLPPNYKPSKVATQGDRHGKKSSPTQPIPKAAREPPPKVPPGPAAKAGQAPAPLIGKPSHARQDPERGSYVDGTAPRTGQRISKPMQTGQAAPKIGQQISQPAQAGQAPPPLKQAEGTTQVDNTGSSFRGWGGGSGSKPEGQAQQLSRYGIKKIIYNRDQKISPKTQRELGLGVHDMKDTHKQVIKQANQPQTWYEWAFGGGKARQDHSHTHIKQ